MRRCIASLCILLALTVLCIGSLTVLRTECRRYAALAEQTRYAAARGDTETALARYDALAGSWEAFHDLTGLFVDGAKLDAVHEHLTGLRPLIEQGHPEVTAELERIRQLTEGIYEEELPKLWHIL